MGKAQLLGSGAACHKKPRIVTIGELLWDLLPGGPRLGGAPANVAFHAARLGADAALISRVGADEDGLLARVALGAAGVDVDCVQVDQERDTGKVLVELCDGEPHYEIARDAAWDHIALGPAEEDVARGADVVCIGSLASRTPAQADRILSLLQRLRHQTPKRRPTIVLDLNLRPPFVDPSTLLSLIRHADVLKVNDEELLWLAKRLGQPPQAWLDERALGVLVVTHGSRGAELFTAHVHETCATQPAVGGDAVGAGDAFVAAFCVARSQDASLAVALARATEHGSFVAGQPGAMPGLEELQKALDR